jgi:hypothetical protein
VDAGAEARESGRLLEHVDLKARLLQQDGGASAAEASSDNCDARGAGHWYFAPLLINETDQYQFFIAYTLFLQMRNTLFAHVLCCGCVNIGRTATFYCICW